MSTHGASLTPPYYCPDVQSWLEKTINTSSNHKQSFQISVHIYFLKIQPGSDFNPVQFICNIDFAQRLAEKTKPWRSNLTTSISYNRHKENRNSHNALYHSIKNNSGVCSLLHGASPQHLPIWSPSSFRSCATHKQLCCSWPVSSPPEFSNANSWWSGSISDISVLNRDLFSLQKFAFSC